MNDSLLTSIVLFLILGVVLAVSANWVVKGASFIAKKFGVRSFIMGFLILGVVTTIPEMFVAYQAVHTGVPQLSLGNLLGGSILLLAFIMGMGGLLLGRIVLNHGMTKEDIIRSSLVIAAPAVVLWDGNLTRSEGAILLGIYIVHVFFISRKQNVMQSIEQNVKQIPHVGHALLFLVVGLVGIAVSSHFLVTIAESIARSFQISPFVIGLFLVTLGTNLPELSLVTVAIMKKKRDIAFGDVLGSAVINTPLIGAVCLAAPFSIEDVMRMRVTLILLAGTALFFLWAASSRRDVTRKEAVGLLILYAMFIAFELLKV